ncbi:MAG: hypothetical protein WAW96_02240 [Alphaproteobacteria bacterium]
MLFHASIPADDPERVARVIAEIWRGDSAPFPPVPGCFIAFADDDRGSTIEVTPRGKEGVPAETETGFKVNPSPSPYSEAHLLLGTPLSEDEVLAIGNREGWTVRVCYRGGKSKLIELWVENKFLLEFMTSDDEKSYRENTSPAKFRAAFGMTA